MQIAMPANSNWPTLHTYILIDGVHSTASQPKRLAINYAEGAPWQDDEKHLRTPAEVYLILESREKKDRGCVGT